jgi:drug/metabolite transporter (DMT)-like permease
LCWSASGIGVRLIETASVWQIVLHRSVSMSLFLCAVIYVMTRQNPIRLALAKGLSGVACGLALVVSYVAGIYSLQNTSVANTLLLFSTAPFMTAILARAFLGEIVRWQTWVAILIALSGVLVMVLGDTRQAALLGDLAALAAALGFAVFTILLRRGKSSDMMPAVLISGLLSIPIMALLCVQSGQTLTIQPTDFAISTGLGIFQMGMGLLLFTLGSTVLPAAKLTLLALSEVFFAPLWVWIFLDEAVRQQTLMGGSILVLAIIWNIMTDQRRVLPTPE